MLYYLGFIFQIQFIGVWVVGFDGEYQWLVLVFYYCIDKFFIN